MNPIKCGHWRIASIEVNSQPTHGSEDFHSLVSTADELRLEPAGISFRIQQATSRSAVLESRSQVFFADFFIRGQQLTLNLSRPAFKETISLKAVYETAVLQTD